MQKQIRQMLSLQILIIVCSPVLQIFDIFLSLSRLRNRIDLSRLLFARLVSHLTENAFLTSPPLVEPSGMDVYHESDFRNISLFSFPLFFSFATIGPKTTATQLSGAN